MNNDDTSVLVFASINIDHLFIHFVHSFIRSFIHSLTYSFTHSFIYSFIHSIIPSLIRSFVYSSVECCFHSRIISIQIKKYMLDKLLQSLFCFSAISLLSFSFYPFHFFFFPIILLFLLTTNQSANFFLYVRE